MSTNLQELIDELVNQAGRLDIGMTTDASIMELRVARANLVAFLARMPRVHVVALNEDGWVLEHPLSCRRDNEVNLMSCPVNDALVVSIPDVELGRYEVRLVDGELIIGSQV